MSRDDKIRDLMRRLVAMSPEPPPFPEEITMAHQQPAERRLHPALVVAITVAAIAALAVPLLLFVGGNEPPPVAGTTSTTTPPSSTTTAPVSTTSTTTAPATTTTTEAMVDAWSGVVFLYTEPQNSFVGNPALVPLRMDVEGPFPADVDFSRALAELAAAGVELPEGFGNAIPPEVIVVSQTTDGELLTADMSEAFVAGAGGALADFTMLNQLIYTLTYQDPAQQVVFTVDGEPVTAFGSEGLDLTSPVGRDSFLDEIHLIDLTEPVVDRGGEGYLVEGIANVFEATLNVEVLDAAGDIVDEQAVTATCGTGCWGEFSVTIEPDLLVSGQSSVRVLTYSPEDGSATDVVIIPVPAPGGIWELTLNG